jgi:hypothetical protein
MPASPDVDARINQLLDAAQLSFKDENEANYLQFQTLVAEVEASARETFQAKLQGMVFSILARLEEGQPLTTAEHNILELLIVGEAKYYLQYEPQLDRWRGQLQQLLGEIEKQRAAGLDEIDDLMRLRALCREAQRVLPDMTYYFHERARVRQFEEATRDAIDVETRRSLANLIKDMMESDQM